MSLRRRLRTITSDLPGAYPLAYCPPGRCFSMSYIRGRCPRLLMVVPSRHRSAYRILVIWTPILTGQMLHIALCCLEGSTLSNLVHRRRRCARIVLHSTLCLEGSTPEDGGGAYHQAKISLWLQGSLFFTAIGSYFVFCGLRRSCKAGLGVTA